MPSNGFSKAGRRQKATPDPDEVEHDQHAPRGRTFGPPPGDVPEQAAHRGWPSAEPTPVRREPTIRRFVDPAEFAKGTDMGAAENQKNSHRQGLLVMLAHYRKFQDPGGGGIPDQKVGDALPVVEHMVRTAREYLALAGPSRDAAAFAAFAERAQAHAAELRERKAKLAKAPAPQKAAAAPAAMPRQHLPGDPNPLFSKVGTAVGIVVPKNGDKGSFNIELTFPTPSGVNVKGSMMVSAERGGGRLKARARIMVGAAVGVAGFAEISAAVGGYLEAEAGDPASLGALLERALFDRVSSTPGMPDMVVGYLFGSGGSSSGAKAAQERMGAIGDRHLKGENYYESGVELEGKAAADEAASVTGGFTAGTRRDARGGPKNSFGISRAIKIETPLELELQLQAKLAGEPGKSARLIGGELAGELVLNHGALTQLQKSADAAMIAAIVFSAFNKAIGAITALSGANETPAGLTVSRLTSGVLGAQAQLIAELMKLKNGLPPPDVAGAAVPKLALSSAVGVGLKLDLVSGKVSVVLRKFTDLDVNVGAVAVKGSRSSEASFDFGGAPPKK